jgi:MFS transporter, DHA2 family, multidrug resistance protein
MMGVLFTLPQFFQGVVGTDAMGSGLRLLALVGGLVAGALPADRVARRVGAKVTVAIGFLVLGAGLAVGSSTRVDSSTTFVAVWMVLVGLGMGLALATASSAALSELSEEHSGIGSAVLQAINKTGGPLGTAVLGSILTSGYLAGLQLTGVPTEAAGVARESIFGAVAVAGRLHSPALLASARAAFVHGMDRSLVVCAGIAVVGMVLSLLFLPGSERREAEHPSTSVLSSP